MEWNVPRRWMPVVAAVTLIVTAVVAAMYANPVINRTPASGMTLDAPTPGARPTSSVVPEPSPTATDDQAESTGALWPLVVVGTLGSIVVLVLFWSLLRERWGRLRRPARPASVSTAEPVPDGKGRLSEAVEESIAELDDTATDPRRAVIACWVRLEQVAATVGTPRSPSDTSTDLVARLLTEHRISAPVLDQLAGLYRAARFAPSEVPGSMRDLARAALGRIRVELGAHNPQETVEGSLVAS